MKRGRPVFGCNLWLEALIRANPGLLHPPGRSARIWRLYPDWLSLRESETGYPANDQRRSFRAAIAGAVRRIQFNQPGGTQ